MQGLTNFIDSLHWQHLVEVIITSAAGAVATEMAKVWFARRKRKTDGK